MNKKKNMKGVMNFSFLVVFFLTTSMNIVQAQKYGHMNLGNFLNELPEVAASNTQLETFQKQLTSKGEQMVKDYEAALTKANAEVEKGILSQMQIQEKQAALQKKQEAILKYEQDVMLQLQKKREELLAPILVRIETAIKEVATENGYQMVFDTSVFNAVLFAEESEDISTKVKAKLGL